MQREKQASCNINININFVFHAVVIKYSICVIKTLSLHRLQSKYYIYNAQQKIAALASEIAVSLAAALIIFNESHHNDFKSRYMTRRIIIFFSLPKGEQCRQLWNTLSPFANWRMFYELNPPVVHLNATQNLPQTRFIERVLLAKSAFAVVSIQSAMNFRMDLANCGLN